jgi:hypothetical protein
VLFRDIINFITEAHECTAFTTNNLFLVVTACGTYAFIYDWAVGD